MSGKTLLANLMASVGLSAAATAQAGQVASGKAGMSDEDSAAGTKSLEALVEAAHAEGVKEGEAKGMKAERARFGAVLTDPETTGQRLGLAITQLSTTDNSPEQIMACIKTVAADVSIGTTSADKGGQGQSGGQRQAKDPLTGKDTIAEDTDLVDTGRTQSPGAETDEKAVANLWDGAFAATGRGITEGSVWSGTALDGQRAN